MTISQLKKLPHGTRVTWDSSGDTGYVVDLRKSKPNAEPPLLYIQWNDGQRTDGRDDLALVHVIKVGNGQ
jgi:hypothetical protein